MNRSFPDVVAAIARVDSDFVWDAEPAVDNRPGSCRSSAYKSARERRCRYGCAPQ
jgi:hypothetical protein